MSPPSDRKVTLIPGDGIGPEVTASARAIVEASGAHFDWDIQPAGLAAQAAGLPALGAAVFESIGRTGLALKGPTGTPFGVPYRIEIGAHAMNPKPEPRVYPSVAIALRKEFDLYMNLRPIRSFPAVVSRYAGVDLLIFRENSEDLYMGRERMVDADTAEAIKTITRGATERAARFACETMVRLGRRKLAIGHKSNVLKLTDGLFLHAAQAVAKNYPQIETRDRVIDALCMELVLAPERYDCLLLANLYGDIVSDLGAGLIGGLGLAPGANIGERCAIFEAVHGTAPDIAGRDIANPMAMILSATMLLKHVGELDCAQRIERALTSVLERRDRLTPDLIANADALRDGKTAAGTSGIGTSGGGTRAMTQAIIEAL
ncbi:MAG: isocitrate/isopropylmalate dehydrogenase family protein [Proteobacteria bacterium]|nr:isocitrate/isopropylmalate dehydrogenase family protein [Burkholderiales bacterium]